MTSYRKYRPNLQILSGDVKLSYENAVKLSQLSQKELIGLANRFLKQNNVYIRCSDTGKAMIKKATVPAQTPIISVKDMPKYDPDAEIFSLKLTIPSWISTIKRVRSSTDRSVISKSAKDQLSDALQQLNECTLDILSFLNE